jgi:putative ABC transport system permease protein
MTLRLFAARLRALWHRRRKESELDEEIAFHLSEEADERVAAGLSERRARIAARRDFGNPAVIREITRDAWGWSWTERLVQDARCGLRMARRDPGFAAVAVLTLALGIGATTAILNVVHALVLRSLPFTEADRVVVLFATTPKSNVFRDTTSFHDFQAWSNQSAAFTSAAAYRRDSLNLTGDGAPEPLGGLRASHELLKVLGVRPVIGRSFDEREQHEGSAVALISYGLWNRRYGADPGILGRTILLNEVSHSIIGVLPPGFQFPPFLDTDVLAPVPERPCRSCGYIRVVARLKPDASIVEAQRELDVIAAGLEKAFPDSNEGRGVNAVPLQEVAIGEVRTPLFMLLAAGVFVLLIGCANVGNLVLARGLARQRELAVRSALGAGAGRLVRQVLTESVSLALVAALIGAVIAVLGSRLLVTSLSQRFPLPDVPFHWLMLAFAALLAVLAGLLSGLPPAVMVWRSDIAGSLKEGRSQSSGGSPQRFRGMLVVSQTALTIMLLAGAGLLLKSFVLLQQVEIGLDPRNVLTADMLLSSRYADPARREAFLGNVLDSLKTLPGVQHAAVQTDSPFNGGGRRETFTIEGRPDPGPRNGHVARCNVVGGEFFQALGTPIVRGRTFDGRDSADSMAVAVVNETLARQFWPNQEAIGKRFRLYYDKNRERWLSVVGVVRDARYRYDLSPPSGNPALSPAQVFLPHQQHPFRTLQYAPSTLVSLVIRTANDPSSQTTAVRNAVWAIDKDQTISNIHSLEEILWQSVAAPRIYVVLLGTFAVIALVIACAGIYGMSAYGVVRRTRELGIRLAIGATSGQILALVIRHGMLMTLIGASIGIAGSLALGRLISGFLFGITTTDAPTWLTVLLLFTVVAFVATYIPARRASKIDPTIAFRYE